MSFPLVGNQVVIGREEGLDITLQDPESSRRHARVTWQAGQFIIEDMGSTNGTFVNGVQITSPQILNAGDSVGIGQTALVFQIAGAQMGAPQYQPPQPQYSASPMPAASPPPPRSSSGGSDKTTQYALYGCGCLLMMAICVLIFIAATLILFPDIFNLSLTP
jgi:predicted component of type VI protein secretion system